MARNNTKPDSKIRPSLRPGTPGGDKEPTEAYVKYVEERDEETTKVYE